MLAMRVRERPWRALLRRSSSGRSTDRLPSSDFETVMGSATLCDSSPLGPLTRTAWPSIVTSTPDGTVTGILPMRDVFRPLSPDVGEDFSAYALLVGLSVREETLAGRDDRHAESAEHLGQTGRLRVDAKSRLADAADAGDRTLTVRAVLERDGERLAHLTLLGLGHVDSGDVALLLEDLGDAGLELGVGHGHAVVVRLVAVADAREHVRDRIGHCHSCVPFLPRFPWGPAAVGGVVVTRSSS